MTTLSKLEITCPKCGKKMVFWINNATYTTNRDTTECGSCGKRIQAILEFEDIKS